MKRKFVYIFYIYQQVLQNTRGRAGLARESYKIIVMKLILASTSPYRKTLLERLQVDFACDSPDIDEAPLAGESVQHMVERLAKLKAEAVAGKYPDALIIGSDQSAVLDGEILTKSGNFENAVKQLQKASGKRIVFQTGLCLLNTATGNRQTACVPYTVVFKPLTQAMIENYLKKEGDRWKFFEK